MTREELLAALLVERYDNTWWKRRAGPVKRDEAAAWDDTDIARAARRKALLEDYMKVGGAA